MGYFSGHGAAWIGALALLSYSAFSAAQGTMIGCTKGARTADIELSVEVMTSMDPNTFGSTCPLLESRDWVRWLGREASGTHFAYPLPYTCLSGQVTEGRLVFADGRTIDFSPLDSFTESAQRIVPVHPWSAPAVDGASIAPSVPVLTTGSAMTLFHLEGYERDSGDAFTLELLADDQFIIEGFDDIEDFTIAASRGHARAEGRMAGFATVHSFYPVSLSGDVRGTLCVK